MIQIIEHAVIEDPSFYEMVEVGYDLVYNPPVTKFMKLTEAAGGRAYNGGKMLLYQGVIAYELWNDTQVPDSLAAQVYSKMQNV